MKRASGRSARKGRSDTERAGAAGQSGPPDWVALQQEATEHLRALIRFPSVNPPGAELPCAEYVHGVLSRSGIESRLLVPAEGRGIVVARLRGSGPGNSGRQVREGGSPGGAGRAGAMLLLAHMDVVGVERAHWSVDPFGAELRDGYVYGRGAIDDKGMLAVNLVATLLVKRLLVDAGVPLARDLVFVASADEETGSEHGLAWLLANHGALVDAEFALNEGGRIRVVDGVPLYAAVQTAEKVPHTVRITASGAGGHASIPLADNSIVRIARALAAVGAHREPLAFVPTTRAFFERLATVWPVAEERAAMVALVSGELESQRRGAAKLEGMPALDALLRNGISATLISGGVRENVIPAAATAVLDVRTLPGQSADAVISALASAIADPAVNLEVISRGVDAPASRHDSILFEAIARTLATIEPRLTVVPYMSTGATDNARLRASGIETCGLLPFPLAPSDEARMHGSDERVPVDALGFGVRTIHGILERMLTGG